MIMHYTANTLFGYLQLPTDYLDQCTAGCLAELAAEDHWRAHPEDPPTLITMVHLHQVNGHDLGMFEVRCEQRSVFTARQLRQA